MKKNMWRLIAVLTVVVSMAVLTQPTAARVTPNSDLQVVANGHDGVASSSLLCWRGGDPNAACMSLDHHFCTCGS